MSSRLPGTVSVVVKHLGTGETAMINPHQQVRAGSLAKLFVLYSAYRHIEADPQAREQILTLTRETIDRNPTSDWRPGMRGTVNCLIEAMMVFSINSATDLLVERLGGVTRITRQVQALGFTQSELTEDWSQTSAADIALLLESIARREAVSPTASDEMLRLLLAQPRDDRLPFPLPREVLVAHKTGELSRRRNDAGIVFAPSGPYVFVALVGDTPTESAAREAVIELSRQVYEHFEPGGLRTVFGLSPRLAEEVFRVPDGEGRIAPLSYDWSKTVTSPEAEVLHTSDKAAVLLRQEIVPDLRALQQDAAAAGAPFWIKQGYWEPEGAELAKVLVQGPQWECKISRSPWPTPTVRPSASATPVPTPTALQVSTSPPSRASDTWLGTALTIAGSPDGGSLNAGRGATTLRWLRDHAWKYGFVLMPAESPSAQGAAGELNRLRWVGRDMAARLHTVAPTGDRGAIEAELSRAWRQAKGPDNGP